MKTRLALLVLVCCLGAGGQTYQGKFVVALPDGHQLATCDNRSSSVALPDLDNCGLVKGATLTHVIMALIHKPYPEPQDVPAKTRRDGWLCNTNVLGDPIPETCKPNMVEELDVPAVKEPTNYSETPGYCSYYKAHPAKDRREKTGLGSICINDYQPWTCADKTRILEHDEQTPPKYWCRKVVSRGTPESESK